MKLGPIYRPFLKTIIAKCLLASVPVAFCGMICSSIHCTVISIKAGESTIRMSICMHVFKEPDSVMFVTPILAFVLIICTGAYLLLKLFNVDPLATTLWKLLDYGIPMIMAVFFLMLAILQIRWTDVAYKKMDNWGYGHQLPFIFASIFFLIDMIIFIVIILLSFKENRDKQIVWLPNQQFNTNAITTFQATDTTQSPNQVETAEFVDGSLSMQNTSTEHDAIRL